MRSFPRSPAATAAVLLLLAGVLGAGCAPAVVSVAPLDQDQIRMRYERALGQREERGRNATADVSLWITLPSGKRLPGASARMLLAAPEGFRIQIGSALGTALDFAARGDTVLGYAPGERLALDLLPASDSIGIANLGKLLYRAWTGAWRPEPDVWGSAVRSDSLTRIGWSEGGDSVEVAIGASGLPRQVDFGLSRDRPVTLEYHAWLHVEGVAWPSSIALVDREGTTLLRARVQRVRFAREGSARRLIVTFPADVDHVTVSELLERAEALR